MTSRRSTTRTTPRRRANEPEHQAAYPRTSVGGHTDSRNAGSVQWRASIFPCTIHDFYNKHYITTDSQGRITFGWSDGPHRDRDTANAICINEQGDYQFRLVPGGVENPPLYTMDGIPLYKWDGEQIVRRTDEEIAANRIPLLKTVRTSKLRELSTSCNEAITAGCDVTLSDGSAGHISLTAEDQINLTNACAAVEGGAEAYPNHLDGELCALYPAPDILAMAQAATAHKLYHTT